jgi:hypothetical protein
MRILLDECVPVALKRNLVSLVTNAKRFGKLALWVRRMASYLRLLKVGGTYSLRRIAKSNINNA